MQTKPEQTDVLALAYLGDAVYELAVRRRIIQSAGITRADRLHRAGVAYVCAQAQASAVKRLMSEGFLSEEEEALTRRAHNHKTATRPKNADPVEYKWATAFEALLGYLELSGQDERLAEIMQTAMEMTENA